MNSNYTTEQFYQALSNFTLTRDPGSKLQYSSFGIGLLGHILSVKAGVSYEKLVEDKILNVLGMNDTKFTLSENENKTRLPTGHQGGQEVASPTLPKDMVGSGSLISTGEDMLKYVSANLGLIHTELDDAMQLAHLIRNQEQLQIQ
jgi:CubicO group peptidase (beta-lactamase class C family)